MSDSGIGLAVAIEAIRSELVSAQNAGRTADVRFALGEVEVELTVEVTKERGAEASVKVLNLLSVGGRGATTSGETNRIKVVLTPVTRGGEPFEVASARSERSDGEEQI